MRGHKCFFFFVTTGGEKFYIFFYIKQPKFLLRFNDARFAMSLSLSGKKIAQILAG